MGYKDPDVQREYQRRWMAKRRVDYFADKSCVECGSTERLELDHIDPSLKVEHKIWSWSRSRFLEEEAKCQVLCHDCHLIKTIASYGPREHGTRRKYDKDRCRCDLCRAANAVHRRETRRRKRLREAGK